MPDLDTGKCVSHNYPTGSGPCTANSAVRMGSRMIETPGGRQEEGKGSELV